MAKPTADTNPEAIDAKLRAALADEIVAAGWGGLSMVRLAGAAGMTPAALYARAPTKWHLLRLVAQHADRAMLAAAASLDDDAKIRDRLFELLMARLDALEPMKPALRRLARELAQDPAAIATVLPGIGLAMGWALQVAGASCDGVRGGLRVAGLSAVFGQAARRWLSDDSADLGATMKTLDQGLKRAERWAGRLEFGPRGKPTTQPDGDASAAPHNDG